MSGECEWGKGKGKRAIGAHGQGVVELNYVKKKTNNGQKTIKISLKTGRKERDHCTHLRDKQDIKNQTHEAHKEGGSGKDGAESISIKRRRGGEEKWTKERPNTFKHSTK